MRIYDKNGRRGETSINFQRNNRLTLKEEEKATEDDEEDEYLESDEELEINNVIVMEKIDEENRYVTAEVKGQVNKSHKEKDDKPQQQPRQFRLPIKKRTDRYRREMSWKPPKPQAQSTVEQWQEFAEKNREKKREKSLVIE